MSIMAVELSASRLLAPYFGSTNFIWTNIIGIIMIALAVGYYFGGRLADRRPQLDQLLKIIILACAYLLVAPLLMRPLANFISDYLLTGQSATLFLFFGSFTSVVILFLLPIMLLGAVSPYIIKLLSVDGKHVGSDSGLVFCVSTAGSILGTFLPTLVFIPTFGTKQTIICFVGLLLLVALWGLFKVRSFLIIIILPLLFYLASSSNIRNHQQLVSEGESAYMYYQIYDQDNLRYLATNDGLGAFSIYNTTPGQYLTDSYFDYYNILPPLVNSNQQNILILGLAGGVISTQLDHYYSSSYDLSIDGVEIDNQIIDQAKKHFNLDNPSLTVHNQDGRVFLANSNEKYQILIVDAYSNQLYIPFHMITEEFFTEARNHLAKDGLLALNLNSTSEDSALFKYTINSLYQVFPYVYSQKIPNSFANYILIASNQPMDFNNLYQAKMPEELAQVALQSETGFHLVSPDNNYSHFTDDRSPTEFLTDWMIVDYLYQNARQI